MFKKGGYNLGRKAVYYIIVIFVLTFIFLYMRNALVDYNDTVTRDADQIEGAIIAAEALFSPKCFVYYDEEIGRAYPGIIDMAKFDDKVFGKVCLPYIDDPYRFKLLDKVIGKDIEESFETLKAPVLILDGDELTPAHIEIGVGDYYYSEGQTQLKDRALKQPVI